MTVHGVISKDSKEDHIYFLSCDRYKILDHGCTIPTKLMRIQETIKNKTFDEGKHKNITLKPAYHCEYGRTTFGKKKCKCHGVCAKACGCVKMGQRCHSGCLCNGNCANQHNQV